MQERVFTVSNKLGLHARPAALLVQTAGRFKSNIKISKGDVQVDGKSIMGILMLAAESGCTLTISASGDDEKEALQELERLFQRKFDEE